MQASIIAYFAVTISGKNTAYPFRTLLNACVVLGNPLGPHMWNVSLSTVTPQYIQVHVLCSLYVILILMTCDTC